MTRNFIFSAFAFSAALSLSACAKPDIHFQTQQVKIETPGARNAKCYLHNEDYRYVAYTGQTLTITKSPNDMNVLCQAAGNRQKEMVIPVELFEIGYHAHKLPEVISVDFRGLPPVPYDLPLYHSPDLRQYPMPTEVEYMGPTTPTLGQEEPFAAGATLEKRQRGSANPFTDGYTSKKDDYDPREEDK